MLMLRGIVRAFVQTGFIAALLLIPAGSWPRAIQYIALFGSFAFASTIVFALLAPASLEARVNVRATKNQPFADRVASLLLFIALSVWFVFIPLDVLRFRLLPLAPPWVPALGVAVMLCGSVTMMAAVWQNSFATPIVGDQSERGQTLVDTGLYGIVRHPMYLGLLLFLLGTALWFQSYPSLIAAPFAFLPILARVSIEERTLRGDLPGYAAYEGRVRYRLVPLVW